MHCAVLEWKRLGDERMPNGAQSRKLFFILIRGGARRMYARAANARPSRAAREFARNSRMARALRRA
jgi:hypothetical protein